jgi:hypothetical protein
MTTPHRATPEQWAYMHERTEAGLEMTSCILELRDRIEALEADQLEQAESGRFCTDAIVRRVETLEAYDKEDANCWAMVRSGMHALRERIEALEAAQQDKLDRLIALDAADPTPDPAMAELRAASAGAQPEPQEEAGEVADWLHDHALSCRELGRNDWAAQSTRAATLLQQLSAIENLKTTNWKARCAELADRLDDALTYTVQSDTERSMRQLITRTRTALAQPEPEGPPMSVPGDAEGLAEVFWGRYEQPEPQGPTERIASIATAVREWAFGWEPTARLIGNVCAEDVADLCGAILTRWGRPTIEPVPVAKRLPGPGDCLGRPWEETDAGFCWWMFPPFGKMVFPAWAYLERILAVFASTGRVPLAPPPRPAGARCGGGE